MDEVKVKGVYKHFKGDLYIVEDVARDCDTLEKVVIYRGLYGDAPIWVRPYDDFIGPVNKEKYPEVEQSDKFELQNIESKRK
jgi:Uncharacterized protein conserved in bacteria